MDVNLRAVIADDQMTTNGHRYTREALEAMVVQIQTKRILIMPNVTVTVDLAGMIGLLTKAELKDVDGHLEVHVEAHAKDPLLVLLQKCERDKIDLAIVPSGMGTLNNSEIGSDYAIQSVGLCRKEESAMTFARIYWFDATKVQPPAQIPVDIMEP